MSETIKYPDIYMDAVEVLTAILESGGRLLHSRYDGSFVNSCEIIRYHFEEILEDSYDKESSVDLTLTYNMPVLSGDVFKTIEKVHRLRFLSTKGDTEWTHNIINKVWDGQYPTTVALDLDTGEVFFVYINSINISLVLFSVLNELELDSVTNDLFMTEPYRVTIKPSAMMRYIDGAEGNNHLKENIRIRFNCGIPLFIAKSDTVE